MITLPLKSTESAKWSDHIRSALASVYGPSNHDFDENIEAFERLHDAVRGAVANTKGLQLLYRYLVQLEFLAMHIPMQPFKTEFTWKNLYRNDSVTQPSVAFEKVNVLYNLAAILATLGAEEVAREDYKAAFHHFSCAAGVLEFASLNFLFVASQDVDTVTLSMLSELMLAQAQHCFYLKAKSGGATAQNHGLLAKLASSAVNLYTEATKKYEQIYDDEWWGNKLHIQELKETTQKLRVEMHSLQAEHCDKVQHKYGDAIAHLREARKLAEDKSESQEIAARIKELERNNDLIYHEKVPAVIPEVKAVQSAKPLQLHSIYSKEDAYNIVGKDLFERVIPIAVHEKASLYSEMKAQFLRDQQEKVEIAGLELTSALEYMNLPAAITKMQQPISEIAEVPSEVQEWSVILATSGELSRPDFEEQRQRILSLLKSQQTVNSTGAIENIHAIKQQLVSAAKADADLQKIYDDIKDTVKQLANTANLPSLYKAELERQQNQSGGSGSDGSGGGGGKVPDISLLDLDSPSPSTTTTTTNNLETQLKEVLELVNKLHKIRTERQSTLADLRQKVHRDDATKLIVANQETPDIEKTVLEPELKKFDASVRRLDATVRLQKSVLNDTATKWKEILASPQAKQATEARERAETAAQQLTARFQTAYEQWRALNEGRDRATWFYSDMERRALNLDKPAPPAVPPKPPVPSKTPTGDGLSGYATPSTYNPSMYR